MSRPTQLQLKQLALKDIAAARQHWENSGVKFPDFLSDRDAFYKAVKLALMPIFIEAGGKEEVFLEAIKEYAREDWTRSGFDEKEFDRRFRSAKWRASTKALIGAACSFLAYIFAAVVNAAFSTDSDSSLGVAGILLLLGVAVFVIFAIVSEIKYKLKNPDDRGVIWLNLK